jgi:poly(3-hydroxybutyrate) depolymerase
VYPGFLQHTGFVAMNPDRHLSSHYDYFLDLIRGDDDSADSHREFYDEYNAVLDMPAEYYLETIRTVFQDFSLVNGTWEVDGKFVRPQDIQTTSLLTVEGELDDISGAGQTRAAHDLCSGIPKDRQFHYDVIGAGHYGIFSGRRWREKVYPEIKAFIRRFDKPVAPGQAVKGAAPKAITAQAAAKAPVKTSARKAVAAPKPAAKQAVTPTAKPAKPAAKRAAPKR